MNQPNDVFDFPRFLRVLRNDLMLLDIRKLGFATLAMFAVGMLIYISATSDQSPEPAQFAFGCFLFLLIGGGSIFTSMIFNDMHHPLERFHYLMLPCSNLERFVSRYLITFPLYTLYAIVLFNVFEEVANWLCALLWDGRTIVELDWSFVGGAIHGYFITHVILFTGAVWFRSYAWLKTWAASMVFWAACGAVMFLAIRLIYWDSFISLFEMNPEGPFPDINFAAGFDAEGNMRPWLNVVFHAFMLWILFLAYLGLKEHEVQDGL